MQECSMWHLQHYECKVYTETILHLDGLVKTFTLSIHLI